MLHHAKILFFLPCAMQHAKQVFVLAAKMQDKGTRAKERSLIRA